MNTPNTYSSPFAIQTYLERKTAALNSGIDCVKGLRRYERAIADGVRMVVSGLLTTDEALIRVRRSV